MENSKNIIAAVLSAIIPGLGQMVKGQFLKGILIMIVGAVVGFLLAWTIIIPMLIWAWNVYDAYTSDNGMVNTTNGRVGV